MQDIATTDKSKLRLLHIKSSLDPLFPCFGDLSVAVFGVEPMPAWPVMAFLDDAGHCVAGLQLQVLTLLCDDAPLAVSAIRNVAVAEDWRGRGLMRDLMARALPWCDQNAGLALLYAESPSLYARHGFAPLPQYAFEADAPRAVGAPTAQRLDVHAAAILAKRFAATRAAVSSLCGVLDDCGMAEHKLEGDTWQLAYDPTLEALIVHEMEGETLVLVDVIAARIPTAGRILGALGMRPARLRTLFTPDKLAWAGRPVPEDAGLMARGSLPPAMRRPFVLPPTFEF